METKIEAFWRDATADKDIARVIKGEKVEARFRDEDYEEWRDGEFLGGFRAFRSIPLAWIDLDGVQWAQCQVYDPQQWWLDRPDPGKGWRLLKKFPDEPKLATDEAWDCHLREWRRTATTDETQSACVWYRRRVESNISEKLDSCVDHLEVGKEYKLPSGQSIFVTEKGFEVF
jgi:hypothetical protein